MQTRWLDLAFAVRPAAFAAAALTVVASTARGQYTDRRSGSYGNGSTEVFEWEGRVDREIWLELRGGRARVQRASSDDAYRRSSGRVLQRLPREDGRLRVRRLEGRGDVDVVQQPSSRNNYTAVLRLRDSRSGAGYYRLVAYWEPSRDGYSRRGDDRTNRRGRDGGWYSTDGRDDRDDRSGGWETRRNP